MVVQYKSLHLYLGRLLKRLRLLEEYSVGAYVYVETTYKRQVSVGRFTLHFMTSSP